MATASKLALGTAQFGGSYGVANSRGQIGAEEGARIVSAAAQAGLDTIDTAITYGDAEQRLGEIGVEGWRVVTKLPGLPGDAPDVAAWVDDQLSRSLQRLRLDAVYALLLHRPGDLAGPDGAGLLNALAVQRARGRTSRVGVSVYDPAQLDAVWDESLDLVQIPFNVLDRRLVTSGWLDRLDAQGKEVHTRSAFLQGLLLMEQPPSYFDRWSGLLSEWHAWLARESLTPLQACLAFVLDEARIDRTVVGVDDAGQLDDILAGAAAKAGVAIPDLSSDDVDLIDPSRWEAE